MVWRHGRPSCGTTATTTSATRPPLLIVFSLVTRSYVLDLTPGNSFVERLLAAGFDVYLLDWGTPDERDAANRLEDYVDDDIPAAWTRSATCPAPTSVNLLGYCFGGDLALLHAAHHPDSPLRSLTVMATPVDFPHWARSPTSSPSARWTSTRWSTTTATCPAGGRRRRSAR